MDNEELLNQIATMLKGQTKHLDNEMKAVRAEIQDIRTELKADIQDVKTELEEDIHAVHIQLEDKIEGVKENLEREIQIVNINMKNDVTKRIDTLFDGYKLNHEKQWEPDRKMENLEGCVGRLKNAG